MVCRERKSAVPPAAEEDEALRFDQFEIRPSERTLWSAGRQLAVGARAFDLLLALAQRRQRMVSKQELLDLVWPGVVVEEHNIAAQISTLRKLLGAQVIATVPGRGYRFTAQPAPGLPHPIDAAGRAPAAASQAQAETPMARPVVTSRLPHHLTPLLGRDDELAALTALLQRCRLVTVVGAGGMGKSLLAQHLLSAQREAYPQGVCWVELASISDAAALPLRIAEALGVRPATGEPLAGLCAAVSSLTMLAALDNAEHLLEDVARAAAALLEAAPGLRLIVTSQAPLRLAAEQVFRVGPLAVPQGPLPAAMARHFSAVALFVERARAADARFVLSDAVAPDAIALCRQLDGLPLAIELAAARAPLLGVPQLAASMRDRLQLLTRNHDASAPARQQTLRATLEWSHAWLGDAERRVFRRLGVMADSASLSLIQQVVADEAGPLDAWAVLDALGTLVDRSLVVVLTDDDLAADYPRYRLLESPRLLAMEQLRDAGEEPALRQRHACALAEIFDAAWHERWSGRTGVMAWARRLLPDASNARDAIAWAQASGDAASAVTLAATLFHVLPRSAHPERMALADLCESLALQVPAALRLRAWTVAVRPMMHRQQQLSLAVADKAVALARELDTGGADRWPLYSALGEWVCAASVVAHPPAHSISTALAELAALEDPAWPAQRLRSRLEAMRLANAAINQGEDQATQQLQLTRRVVACIEAEGQDPAPIMGTLIDAELQCGHVEAAVALGERMLDQLAGTRDEYSRLMVRVNLNLAYMALDQDTRRVRPTLQAVWSVALQFGIHALCSDSPALLAALEARPQTAALLAGYADAAFAARDLIRHPLEAKVRERTHTLARAALGDAEFKRLMAEGSTLHDEEIGPLAFRPDSNQCINSAPSR